MSPGCGGRKRQRVVAGGGRPAPSRASAAASATTGRRCCVAVSSAISASASSCARAGYVEVAKAFVARRPRTTVKASPAGRAAFAAHVAFRRAIIAGA